MSAASMAQCVVRCRRFSHLFVLFRELPALLPSSQPSSAPCTNQVHLVMTPLKSQKRGGGSHTDTLSMSRRTASSGWTTMNPPLKADTPPGVYLAKERARVCVHDRERGVSWRGRRGSASMHGRRTTARRATGAATPCVAPRSTPCVAPRSRSSSAPCELWQRHGRRDDQKWGGCREQSRAARPSARRLRTACLRRRRPPGSGRGTSGPHCAAA